MTRTDLRTAIAERPVVLDGGLATLLEEHGHDLSSDLWSARLLRDDPAAIERPPGFFTAGAEVADHGVVQVSFEGFGARAWTQRRGRAPAAPERRAGCGRARTPRARRMGGRLGRAVRRVLGRRLGVPRRLRPRRGRPPAFHRPGSTCSPDVLRRRPARGRDRPCLAEVEAVLAELDGSGVPAWLSLSTANGLTRAGEPIGEAFAMAADVAEVVAVGVNCSSPADAGAAVPVAGAHGPAVVYPNSGQGWNAATRSWEGRSAFDPADVAAWVAAGARLVGGCCRVGTGDITALRATLARTDLTS